MIGQDDCHPTVWERRVQWDDCQSNVWDRKVWRDDCQQTIWDRKVCCDVFQPNVQDRMLWWDEYQPTVSESLIWQDVCQTNAQDKTFQLDDCNRLVLWNHCQQNVWDRTVWGMTVNQICGIGRRRFVKPLLSSTFLLCGLKWVTFKESVFLLEKTLKLL